MTTRRDFLKAVTLAGNLIVLDPRRLWARTVVTEYFGLNDFVGSRPDAVFILRTGVDGKTNAEAIRKAGLALGSTLFVNAVGPANAWRTDGRVVIKPNITQWTLDIPPLNIEQTMGIQTDPNFVEGIMQSLNGLGVANANISIREANYAADRIDGQWYLELARRTGLDLAECPPLSSLPAASTQWLEVPGAVWYRRIPYLTPVNAPGSCLINIAKFKSHGMGMTLCSKNLQGTNAVPYVRHCSALSSDYGFDPGDIVPDARTTIVKNYVRHRDAGIPRWSLPGDGTGGLWQETHASRCLDNVSVTHPMINIIEGIYGREGSHTSGPADNGGYGRDVMTNIVVFGVNPLHVDLVGTFLAGHEPGNFGLFHLAKERGLSHFLNPRDVQLFEWHADGTAELSSLANFPRAALRTVYQQQPGEEAYHMVNEPYAYASTGVAEVPGRGKPDLFVLSQNYPNPFNPTTTIQYSIPAGGNVRLEVFDIRGQLVDLLVDAFMPAGQHLQVWSSQQRSSGTYLCRLTYRGMQITNSMVLVR